MNTQPLATGLMIKLCCKYLSLRCMWRMMHVIMLCTSFRENLYSMVCLNVKELLARNRCHIWSLSNNSEIWTHNHLICKRTLNCLAKLAKWLSCDMSTYLYGASDCVLLSCHVRVSEWIYTFSLPECQGTLSLK